MSFFFPPPAKGMLHVSLRQRDEKQAWRPLLIDLWCGVAAFSNFFLLFSSSKDSVGSDEVPDSQARHLKRFYGFCRHNEARIVTALDHAVVRSFLRAFADRHCLLQITYLNSVVMPDEETESSDEDEDEGEESLGDEN